MLLMIRILLITGVACTSLFAADPAAKVRRLTVLGATVHAQHPDHTVLTDPEGNEFCLFRTD